MQIKPPIISLILALAAGCVLLAEQAGLHTGLSLHFHGDIAREARWLTQFGQFACATCVVLAIWLLDPPRRPRIPTLIFGLLLAATIASGVKVATGRVRPTYDDAGQFHGPLAKGGASQRSFPSGHTTSAFALAASLAMLYPRGRALFWTMATTTGALRWVQDAHWLSDVLAGAALGVIVVHRVGSVSSTWYESRLQAFGHRVRTNRSTRRRVAVHAVAVAALIGSAVWLARRPADMSTVRPPFDGHYVQRDARGVAIQETVWRKGTLVSAWQMATPSIRSNRPAAVRDTPMWTQVVTAGNGSITEFDPQGHDEGIRHYVDGR